MTRVVVIDPQPAVRAGLADDVAYRAGPGPGRLRRGCRRRARSWSSASGPTSSLLDPQLRDGDGLGTARRLRMLDPAPRVVLYAAGGDPSLPVTARVAGADGLVDKEAARGGAVRGDPAGRPRRDRAAAARSRAARRRRARVDPEDLALLAMLVDRTSHADVAATLRMQPRKLARRIERLLGKLRARPARSLPA